MKDSAASNLQQEPEIMNHLSTYLLGVFATLGLPQCEGASLNEDRSKEDPADDLCVSSLESDA